MTKPKAPADPSWVRTIVLPGVIVAVAFGLIALLDRGWHYRVLYSAGWGCSLGVVAGLTTTWLRRRAARSARPTASDAG